MTADIQEWLKAENEKLRAKRKRSSYRTTRGYVHFDARSTPEEVIPLLADALRIATHSFTPFLSFEKELRRYRYRDDPTRRVKRRLLSYACHTDAFIYSWYAFQLHDPYERLLQKEGLAESIIAYRPMREDDETRSTIDFAHEVFEHIRSRGQCVAVTLDIRQFFDRVQHGYLKCRWAEVIGSDTLPDDHYHVFRSLTMYVHVMLDEALKALGLSRNELGHRSRLCSEADYYSKIQGQGLVRQNPNYRHGMGIPQGSPISGILSNIYLWQFDRSISALVRSIGGLYRRYCDDVVVVCGIEHAEEVAAKAATLIQEARLEIQKEKTVTTYFRLDGGSGGKLVACSTMSGERIRKPMQYLGFEFDGTKSHLRSGTVARFMRRLMQVIHKQVRARSKNYKKAKEKGKLYKPKLNRKKILTMFSHLGRRNLQAYARRAHERYPDISTIPSQLKKLDKRVKQVLTAGQRELDKRSADHLEG